MKKSMCVVLAGIVMSGSLAGLTGCLGGPSIVIDEEKTQLYVGNYNGGVGDKWLDEIIPRFEAAYADYQLNGKTGVQVIKDSDKDCTGKTLGGTLSADPN